MGKSPDVINEDSVERAVLTALYPSPESNKCCKNSSTTVTEGDNLSAPRASANFVH